LHGLPVATVAPVAAVAPVATIAPVATVRLTGTKEDFITTRGKQYTNVIVTRVEPDGILVKYKSGISKLYFAELPKEVQQRFHYDPVRGTQFNVAVQAAAARFNANAQQEESRKVRR
jgi:hypothetical protein